jgi:hypothetical protein
MKRSQGDAERHVLLLHTGGEVPPRVAVVDPAVPRVHHHLVLHAKAVAPRTFGGRPHRSRSEHHGARAGHHGSQTGLLEAAGERVIAISLPEQPRHVLRQPLERHEQGVAHDVGAANQGQDLVVVQQHGGTQQEAERLVGEAHHGPPIVHHAAHGKDLRQQRCGECRMPQVGRHRHRRLATCRGDHDHRRCGGGRRWGTEQRERGKHNQRGHRRRPMARAASRSA